VPVPAWQVQASLALPLLLLGLLVVLEISSQQQQQQQQHCEQQDVEGKQAVAA
jgi:preprotein translocase subunit YajC